MIEARVVEDSIGAYAPRLTTLVMTYWRGIHSEFMTHRAFSRNASSSRAIPVEKMLQAIRENPFVPIHWGKNQPGMQAREELSDEPVYSPGAGVEPSDRARAKLEWLAARDSALEYTERLMQIGLHKQLANRLTETWSHITVVVTGTEWSNFYSLRCHPDAEPHMQALAEAALKAMNESEPHFLEPNEWHLPFVSKEERDHPDAKKLSVARCARVSYLNHDRSAPDPVKDIELHDKLLASGHMSPFEHQARPLLFNSSYPMGNLCGWEQYRKTLLNECRESFDRLIPKSALDARRRRYGAKHE